MSAKRDSLVIGLLFTAASLGVVAASDVPPPVVKMSCAAVAAGCASVLAVMRPVGDQTLSTRQDRIEAIKQISREHDRERG